MVYKDQTKAKEAAKEYREKNRERIEKYRQDHIEKNRLYQEQYYANIIACGMAMILSGVINDKNTWHLYCQRKRCHKQYPYSDDFTDDMIFEKMKDGCVYCGDFADTIDRVDSNIDHVPDNCIGCCKSCNISKGNGDPNSFIRKAYFRTYGQYYDDIDDIWSDNKKKPSFHGANLISQKQQRDFTLTQDQWDLLIVGDCVYCQRSKPDKKWFGIDRIIPSKGYTIDNTVSCCHDCNNDKLDLTIDVMKKRNLNIARRLKKGVIDFFDCDTSLRTKNSSTKKVCAYGKVYSSYDIASNALVRNDRYITNCIYRKRHSDDIFEISDDFYEFAVETKLENITKKMYILFNRL